MDKIRGWINDFANCLGKTKAKILGWGLAGVVLWYSIYVLWWIIKAIICFTTGICILFP